MYNTNQIYGMNPYFGYMNQQNIPQNGIQNKPLNLQGKVIDNLEVVKGTDIILDGTVNYFPLADGSAIATKQLQPNGTSKITIYRPVEDEPVQEVKYVTEKDFSDIILDINGKINDIQKQLENSSKKKEK